jgi:hypothetical protein
VSKILFAVLGGTLLASAPLLAAAQPDPADKPVVDVPYPPEKPIEVHGSLTEAVAAATADRTLRAESMDGLIVNTIYLDRDGSLRIVDEEAGGVSRGHWFARGGNVCVEWRPRGRECWPFDQVAEGGAPSVVTSDRGQTIRVRVLS